MSFFSTIVNYLSSAEEKERKEGIDVNDISPAVNKDIQASHSQEGLSEDPMPQENTQYNPKDADQITDGIDVTSSHENTQDNPKDADQITDGIDVTSSHENTQDNPKDADQITDGIDVTSSHDESEAIQNSEVCPPKSVSSEIESSVEMNEKAKKYPVFDPILVNVENVLPIQKDGATELQPNNIAEEIPQTNAEIVQTNKTDLPEGNASHDESIQPHSSNAIDVCDDKNLKVDTELKIKKEILDETAHQQSGSVQTTITKSMVDEEDKFKSEQQVVKTEVVEQLHQASQRQRYDRLQILLDRSQLYAKYLLDRINARSDEENKCKEKQKKRKKKDTNETIDLTKGKRKREEEVSDRPEDYIDKAELEERIKRQKLDKENCSPKVTEKDEAPQKVDTFSRTINGKKVSDRQPKLLTGGVMREYQLDGMEWLHGLFENGINGILADEMGLGKTIQSIALITSLIELNVVGPFIIAAPLSTLPNWINEFKKFTPELKTMLYHGTIEERENMRNKLLRLKRYSTGHASLPIVISSYEILMRDRPCFSSMKLEWKYLIVDEGHRIKNLNSKLIKELKLYKTANRLLLTGTPLQNNLSELWSLLNFLLPDIFDDLSSFQSWFDFSAVDEQDNEKLIAQEKEANVLQKLHSILTPFLLRRLKTDVDLSIPPKKEVIVYAPLTAQQQLYYKTTLDRTIIQVLDSNKKKEETVEYTPSGRPKRKSRVNRNYAEYDDNSQEDFDLDKLISHVEELEKRKAERVDADLLAKKMSKKAILNIRLQNVMMQLRKCCNHPYLLEYPFDPATQQLIVDENVITSSGKMLLLDRMIAKLKSDGHKVLIFSQMTLMLDIIQDFCSVRNYKYSRIDGSMNILARQENIKNFEDDPEHFIFLLSTRAGGLGLNLMMADTCIIFDSDWNPQQDLQAQDRCHRIGQTKPVVVYRFVTANTIDQRIIERAASKRKLEKMVIHKKNFKGGASASLVSPKELLELLESKDAHSTMEAVISDADLAKLLDRSDLQDWDKNKKASSGLAEQTNENTDPLFKVVDHRANDVVI